MLIPYLRGNGDLTKRVTIRHDANGSNIDDVRCDIISSNMSNIDQKVRVASAHVGYITALPVASFGDGEFGSAPASKIRGLLWIASFTNKILLTTVKYCPRLPIRQSGKRC